jgi:hypothetical protein
METKGSPFTRFVGVLLLMGGLSASVYYYLAFDTSVQVPKTVIMGQTFGGGRVNNLGLMQDRQNGILFGFGAAILGGVLTYLGRGQTKTAAAAADERKCPFCAEVIKVEAKVCRFCQKELPLPPDPATLPTPPGRVYYSEGWWRAHDAKRYGPFATREQAERTPPSV